MADGKISLAFHSCRLAMNFSSFPASVFIVVTLVQSFFHCVLGLSFLRKNPAVDWQTGSLKFNEYHIVTCPIQSRPPKAEVVQAKAMARKIKKKDPSTIFFAHQS
jgi:hypothetical protein